MGIRRRTSVGCLKFRKNFFKNRKKFVTTAIKFTAIKYTSNRNSRNFCQLELKLLEEANEYVVPRYHFLFIKGH